MGWGRGCRVLGEGSVSILEGLGLARCNQGRVTGQCDWTVSCSCVQLRSAEETVSTEGGDLRPPKVLSKVLSLHFLLSISRDFHLSPAPSFCPWSFSQQHKSHPWRPPATLSACQQTAGTHSSRRVNPSHPAYQMIRVRGVTSFSSAARSRRYASSRRSHSRCTWAPSASGMEVCC